MNTPKTIRNRRAVDTLTLTDMPKTPNVGMQFNPDTTSSIGVIEAVTKGKVNGRPVVTVTYHYTHEPAVKHTRPYAEVQGMAWKVVA